ncbi:hypothetical protein VVR12_04265 [Rothia sp. LK2588]|uniref:hypothetical protein n=1 Tax=Rothia sp. LK2588 TaxID=3114369 RepID=UPI0034CDCFD4
MVFEKTGRSTLSAAEEEKIVRSTRRTDLRNIIGALFLVYGIIVFLVGMLNPAADIAQTGGIHINLWTGLGMFITGVLFLLWSKFLPVPAEDILSVYKTVDEKKAEGAGSLD